MAKKGTKRTIVKVLLLTCALLIISCSSERDGTVTQQEQQPSSCTPATTPEEARLDGTITVPSELCTIQAGLDAALSGDIVLVEDGTYKENLIWPAVDGITLKSVNGAESTVIDGGGNDEVILIHRSSFTYNITNATVIDGFTITNGYARSINKTAGL